MQHEQRRALVLQYRDQMETVDAGAFQGCAIRSEAWRFGDAAASRVEAMRWSVRWCLTLYNVFLSCRKWPIFLANTVFLLFFTLLRHHRFKYDVLSVRCNLAKVGTWGGGVCHFHRGKQTAQSVTCCASEPWPLSARTECPETPLSRHTALVSGIHWLPLKHWTPPPPRVNWPSHDRAVPEWSWWGFSAQICLTPANGSHILRDGRGGWEKMSRGSLV